MRLDQGCKCGAARSVYCDEGTGEKLMREFEEEHKGKGHALCTTVKALRYRRRRDRGG